ncbi:MAG: putative transport system permease protein, partial [Acidobacteriaceae bacterium]|nr:putative transport system permease protein [Acidobacteriaceae bacterium]
RNLARDFARDLQFAARQLRRSPLFASTIIATFALGIAANTAIFSVMDALVLRPLAVPELDRIVTVAEQRGSELRRQISFPDYQDYQQQSHAFEELAARAHNNLTLTLSGQSEHVQATHATPNLFALFGVLPQLGRTFVAGEDQPGRDGEAVLTHNFWLSHFGGRPDAIGSTIVLDGRLYDIIGVMPRSFDHVDFTDVWLPLALSPQQRSDRTAQDYMVSGRLRSGVTMGAASEELIAIAAGIARRSPGSNQGWTIRVRKLVETINGDLTPEFTHIIFAATLLLMLVVCANISNLQFARTLRRAPEMAVRSALGSSRLRLLRQLLAESLLQSMLGAVGGLLMARVALHVIVISMPSQVARFLAGWGDIRLSVRTLVYSAALAVAAGLLAGLSPALAGMRINLLEQLKLGGRSVSGSRRGHRLRGFFAGAQIMMATGLLAGAVCIAASMYTMLHAASRFAPRQALLLNTYLPPSHYATPVQQAAFLRDSLERLAGLPGVRSAAFTTALPYNNTGVWEQDLTIVGDPPPPGHVRITQRLTVSPGYLQTVGLSVLRGRGLSPSDGLETPLVALISERLAKQYFGDRDPLGDQIQLGRENLTRPATIVGVVADVVYTWVDQQPRPAVYLSSNQFPTSSGTYVLRGEGDVKGLATSARQSLAAIDSRVPVDPAETYQAFLRESLTGLSYTVVMLGADAGIGLVLCAIGIFGVMSNLVTERTHEIGIRFAVGADRSAILLLLLRRSFLVTGLGLGGGLILAMQVGRVLTSILAGVQGLQLAILLAATGTVALVSMMAVYIPARRAATVDPGQALRIE